MYINKQKPYMKYEALSLTLYEIPLNLFIHDKKGTIGNYNKISQVETKKRNEANVLALPEIPLFVV